MYLRFALDCRSFRVTNQRVEKADRSVRALLNTISHRIVSFDGSAAQYSADLKAVRQRKRRPGGIARYDDRRYRSRESRHPGYFVAATTLTLPGPVRPDGCEPLSYLDAAEIPFFVLPNR